MDPASGSNEWLQTATRVLWIPRTHENLTFWLASLHITESFHLLPDQALIVNPVLILIFIPVFNWMYKMLEKCITLTTLRKQNVGMLLAALAYLVSAAVQVSVN